MRIQTWDNKVFDVPEENLEGFLQDYNKATNFDPATLSADPSVNPERGTNFGGGARAFAQGLPVIGSYADEAEAYVRSLVGDKSYDEYLKNARESTEGAFKNMPEVAYPLNIGAGIAGEAALAALTGGASLTPQAQAVMGAAYGYGAGEGNIENRLADAAIIGGASAALPVAGRYIAKAPAAIKKSAVEYATRKIPNVIKSLQKVANPRTDTIALYKNASGKTDINILSSLMNGADDYATQSKVATELIKETPKSAALYESGIMKGANDLVNIGWKNQVTGAIDDVARSVSNEADRKILAKISDKLSKATKETIESAENALEEMEFKDVRDVVDYAIKEHGKGLTEETKKLLEKRMVSEGMAKRVAKKIAGKDLAESAKKSTAREITKDLVLGAAADIALPGSGLLFALGRNAVFGGGGTTAMKKIENKVADKVLEKTMNNTIKKAATGAVTKDKMAQAILDGEVLTPEIIKYQTRQTVKTSPTLQWLKKAKESVDPYLYLQPTTRSLITNSPALLLK